VYHPNPTDAKTIGSLVSKYSGTFLLSTPTFCAAYARKCSAEEFRSLRYVLVGAEKLREPVAKAFEEKFGIALLEGYGCTEMAPVVSVNVPDYDEPANRQVGGKPGTVGHPVPGVAVKVIDPDSGACLPGGVEGLLLTKGPNRMLGYLGQPDKTAEAVRDGWYVTGDIAVIDDDGFLRITDRLSRFSKIGGEMVPHLKVEDAISRILSDNGGDHGCAVAGVPDEQRGERLVALHTCPGMSPAEIWQRLSETELPKLWLPKRDSIHYVDALPLLGSGKLDLRRVNAMAKQLAGGTS
jgi:acyl-[acyl-carrier-protein]-phospholipid O-acyltransferase/long-chain-fatty-acid--[acyl-carrier-protein] ligase